MARGGGGDGIIAMAKMNQSARLHRWGAVAAELWRCCGGARCGAAERQSEQEGVRAGEWMEWRVHGIYARVLA